MRDVSSSDETEDWSPSLSMCSITGSRWLLMIFITSSTSLPIFAASFRLKAGLRLLLFCIPADKSKLFSIVFLFPIFFLLLAGTFEISNDAGGGGGGKLFPFAL